MTDPTVSVVIPTSGRWNRLERTLSSALAQQGVDFEVIVAIDSDEDPPSLPGLADGRVSTVRPPRHGLSHARNAGVDAAEGEWISFLDDDDLWADRKLSAQLAMARENTGFVYSGAFEVDDGLRRVSFMGLPDPRELAQLLLRSAAIPAGASNVIARASLVRDCGGFDSAFRHLADWDLWIRLAEQAGGAALPERLVAYVQHGQSMFREDAEIWREFDRLKEKHSEFASRRGAGFDPTLLEEWIGQKQRTTEAGGWRPWDRHPARRWGFRAIPAPDWLSAYRPARRRRRARPARRVG